MFESTDHTGRDTGTDRGPRVGRLANALASRDDRRGALRLIGGALAAGLVARIGPDGAAAQSFPLMSTYVLSGGAFSTTPLGVDDDLAVTLNGLPIVYDADGFADEIPPIFFYARPGDQLRVVATNVDPYCYAMDPLYLHGNGGSRLLAQGVVGVCGSGQMGVFFDRTFVI